MDIKYLNQDDSIYAELSGELDEYSAEYVRISLDDLLNKLGAAKKLFLDFSIATNPQPLKEMGKKAAEMLFERIKNPELESSSHIFQVPFLSGDSIKSI